MAKQDPTQCFRVPSRLCVGPTSCAPGATFPYGGKKLGRIVDAHFRPGIVTQETVDEGWAMPRRVLKTQERPGFVLLLQQYDLDALGYFFALAAGPQNGFVTQAIRGGQPSGPATEVGGLLVAPLDIRHPALYVPRPMPRHDFVARWSWLLQEYLTFPLVFTPGVATGKDL